MNSVINNFPGEVDIINLLALTIKQIEKRLSNIDVIFVIGGDADYLMSVYQKTGFDKFLPKLLENKVYVGRCGFDGDWRAGFDAAYRLIYGEDGEFGVSNYLDLVNFSIMPHLDSPHFPNRKESLFEAVDNLKGKVYGLRDDSAAVVDGDKIKVIGSKPVVIEGGVIIDENN